MRGYGDLARQGESFESLKKLKVTFTGLMHAGEDRVDDVNWCLTPNASARNSFPGADAAVGVCRQLERTHDSRPDDFMSLITDAVCCGMQ